MGALRILIIRTGGLGDSLLLWPAVAAVRRRHPGAHLALLGHRARLALLVGPGGADEALEVEGSGLHLLYGELAEPSAELLRRFGAWDAVVAYAAEGDLALGENLAACGAREAHVFLPPRADGTGRHAAEQVLADLAAAGLAESAPLSEVPALPVPEGEAGLGAERLRAAGLAPGRVALLAPGSGSPQKCWPAWRFAELAARLAADRWQPAWVAGPADAIAIQAVREAGGRAWPVLADAEPGALRAIVDLAGAWVGCDSGPTHLAGLLGRPCLGLFGPTDPDVWRPLGPRARALRSAAACAPCPAERRQACDDGRCFEGLEVDEVHAALRQVAGER